MPPVTPSPSLENSPAESPMPPVGHQVSPSAPATKFGTARKGILALVDQALVSGSRFATTILVGRYCGQQALGHYSLGFSLLLIATCIQEALITAPYTVLHVKRRGEAGARYNGSVLIHVLLLAVLSAMGFGAAWWASRQDVESGLPMVLGCLAITTPFALLREFARRIEFAHLRLKTSILVDGSVALLQLGMLGYLSWRQSLTAGTAVLTIGLSSALAGSLWLWSMRLTFQPKWREVWQDLREGWHLGRWVFLAQLTGLVHLQGMLWLIAAWLSPEQTGLFAACNTLVQFINPFALGLNNFISPLTVRTMAERGLAAARRMVAVSMVMMFSCVLLFSLVMAYGSDTVLSFILPKAMPVGQGPLVFILGLNLAFNAAHMINDGGVWAMERPQAIFYSSVIAVLVSGIASAILIPHGSLMGAAVSLLIGRFVAVSFQASVFFFVVEPQDLPNHQGRGTA